MSNWTNFVREFALANGISYSDALREAAPYYHAQMGHGEMTRTRRVQAQRRTRKQTRATRSKKPKGKNREFYDAGVLIGGALGGARNPPKGALAALLSGLNANIKVQ